jgi:thiamine pyrophosphate-dependent acetolactate synthase large subunit-like protein
VVIGIFIGTFFANRFSGNRLSIINSGSNKLNDLLHIIDDQYVDTVNMNDLVETAMPQILSELDPHSVYISAKDVQQALGEYEPVGSVVADEPSLLDASRLAEAAACINACHRPLVYFGGGVVAAGAEQELLALADKTDAPIACSLMGLSAVPTDHPRFLGMEGMHGHYAATMAMKSADCIIALGCRFSDRSIGNRDKFGVGVHIVHVDVDRSELSKNTND